MCIWPIIIYIARFHELIWGVTKWPLLTVRIYLPSRHYREVYWWNFFRDETWEVKSMLFISHWAIMPWDGCHWNIFSRGGYILLNILHTVEVGANTVLYLSSILFQYSLSSVHANSQTHHVSYLEHLMRRRQAFIEPLNASCSMSVTIKHTATISVFICIHSDDMCLTVGKIKPGLWAL